MNALVISESGQHGPAKLCQAYLGLTSAADLWRLTPPLEEANELFNQAIGKRPFTLNLAAGGTGDPTRGLSSAVAEIDNIRRIFTIISVVAPIGSLIVADYALGELQDKLVLVHRALRRAFQARALYRLTPLNELIESTVDPAQIGTIPLRITVCGLDKGRLATVDEAGTLRVYEPGIGITDTMQLWSPDSNPVIDAVLASASIPVIFEPISLRRSTFSGDNYVDGGVRDLFPVTASKEFAADRIVAVLASPIRVEQLNAGEFNLFETGGRALEIAMTEVLDNDIAELNAHNSNVLTIEPWFDVHGSLVVDPGLIRINIAYGYSRAWMYWQGAAGVFNDLGTALGVLLEIDLIKDLRLESWKAEERLLERRMASFGAEWTTGQESYAEAFDPVGLQRVRETKRQLVKAVDMLVEYAGGPECLPKLLPAPGGANEPIQDWWRRWERHSGPALNLDQYDIWSPLPIWPIGATTFSTPAYESPTDVGTPPSSQHFG